MQLLYSARILPKCKHKEMTETQDTVVINASPVTEASEEQTNPRYFSSDIVYSVRAAAVRLLQAPCPYRTLIIALNRTGKQKALFSHQAPNSRKIP